MTKQIHLNAFAQHSVSPHAIGLWKHPDHEGDAHGSLSYWLKLSEILERGTFDTLFLADVLGIYDVYEGSSRAALEQAVQVPAHDPTVIVSALAQATKHLGFAVTVSATYASPYKLARLFSTLDHVTDGRIAWNVVTGYLESEARNLGLAGRIQHDERYDRADEFLEVVYKLWEQSWERDAIVKDVQKGRYIDSSKVHPIRHEGKYFDVPGIHLVDPSPQRTPVLFQAGASSRGRDFAAKHAEAIFTDTQNSKEAVSALRSFTADLRRRLQWNGRRPDALKVFPGFVPVVGSTEEEAWRNYEELKSYVNYDGSAALLSGHAGFDFSTLDPDEYVENLPSGAIQSTFESYTSTKPDAKWTVRDAILHHGIGAGSTPIVGTPEQIADRLETLVVDGGADGFNVGQTVTLRSIETFVDEVVPELRARSLFRETYEDGTLRERLFGKGQRELRDDHYGRRVTIEKGDVFA